MFTYITSIQKSLNVPDVILFVKTHYYNYCIWCEVDIQNKYLFVAEEVLFYVPLFNYFYQ